MEPSERVQAARTPEGLFGRLSLDGEAGRQEIARQYRQLALALHPDHGGNQQAFAKLSALYRAAQEAMAAGTYGQGTMTDTVLIQTRRHAYRVVRLAARGQFANLYSATYETDDGTQQALLSIVRKAQDGKLLAHEAKVLKEMLTVGGDMYDLISPYLPGYIEAFGYRRGRVTRQGIAYREQLGLFSLRDVQSAYPTGVHPKDSAWMLRRILMGLGLAHGCGWAHGEINQDHILVNGAQHGAVLVDWTRAVTAEAKSARADVAAGVAAVDAVTNAQRPMRLQRFFEGCQRHPQRLPDAFTLMEEYTELIEDLWGPRRYRPFVMA